MAARRATQFIALRNLSRNATQHHQLAPVATLLTRKTIQHAMSPSTRAFSLSASYQASRDTSTIDFFYFPSIDLVKDDLSQPIRVPILPDNYDPPRTGAHAPEVQFESVHKPEINTMSMDSNYLPMAENHDGHAMNVDFHAMADRVAANIENMKVPVEEQASIMKQLWNDMVDDILGAKKKVAT